MNKPIRITAALFIMAIVSVALAACGGSGGAKLVATQDTEAPAAAETAAASVTASADTPAETTAAVVAETTTDETPADTPADTDVASMADTVELVVNGTPEPEVADETVESAVLTSYSDYGFNLKLDLGAEVQASGWTEAEPSLAQGIIAFTYGGVNTNIVWGPHEERTNLTFLADTYNILRASQPAITFESISDGEISISEQEGVYGGFKAVDDSGTSIGGGLIGTLICGGNGTPFRTTLTGGGSSVGQPLL
ncbi:MAG: hypothetical protein H8E48_00290 [Chloroflexi bacterium]|nr:hypothetical protein [Chloroflexota bacterium]